MHVVLVDNGRSERLSNDTFWYGLKCIRCGACMNTCPVFRRSGGLSYGSTYPGPIGIVISPTFDKHKFSRLPFSSTLNGSCTNVCPVKINLHEQIASWRQVMSESSEMDFSKKNMMRAAGYILSHPRLYRGAITMADSALNYLPHFMIYNRLNTWGQQRDMPDAPKQSFHAWYKQNYGNKEPS